MMFRDQILGQSEMKKLTGAVELTFKTIQSRGSTVAEYIVTIESLGLSKKFELAADFPIINRFVDSLSNEHVDGQPLTSYFSSDDVHFWQYVHGHAWPIFYNLVIPYMLIQQIAELKRVTTVQVTVPFLSRLSKAFSGWSRIAVSNDEKPIIIKRDYTNCKFQILDFLRRRLSSHVKALVYMCKFLLKRGFGLRKKHEIIKADAVILTYSGRYSLPCKEYPDKCFGLIRREIMDSGYSCLLIDLDDSNPNEHYVPISSFYGFHILTLLSMIRAAKKLPRYKSEYLENSCTALPENIRKSVYEVIRECHIFYRTVAIIDYLIGREVCDQIVPKFSLATYETGGIQRSVAECISKRSGHSFGFQHGMMLENNYDYYHENISIGHASGHEFVSVPDVTFVWGFYWERVLTQAFNYPKAAVLTSGDWLVPAPSSARTYNDRETSICICTNTVDTADYLVSTINVIAAVAQDFVIYIALHPAERARKDQIFSALVDLLPSSVSERLKFCNSAFEGYSKCGVLVSQPSFVLFEAIRFSCTVVLADYLDSALCKYFSEIKGIRVINSPDQLAGLLIGQKTDVESKVLTERSEFWAFHDTSEKDKAKNIVKNILQRVENV